MNKICCCFIIFGLIILLNCLLYSNENLNENNVIQRIILNPENDDRNSDSYQKLNEILPKNNYNFKNCSKNMNCSYYKTLKKIKQEEKYRCCMPQFKKLCKELAKEKYMLTFNTDKNLVIQRVDWQESTLKNDCNRDLIKDDPSCRSSCPFSIPGMSDNNQPDDNEESEFCKEFCGNERPCIVPCRKNNCNNCLDNDDEQSDNTNEIWSKNKCKNYFKETRKLNPQYKLCHNLPERICENNCGNYCKWNPNKAKCIKNKKQLNI